MESREGEESGPTYKNWIGMGGKRKGRKGEEGEEREGSSLP